MDPTTTIAIALPATDIGTSLMADECPNRCKANWVNLDLDLHIVKRYARETFESGKALSRLIVRAAERRLRKASTFVPRDDCQRCANQLSLGFHLPMINEYASVSASGYRSPLEWLSGEIHERSLRLKHDVLVIEDTLGQKGDPVLEGENPIDWQCVGNEVFRFLRGRKLTPSGVANAVRSVENAFPPVAAVLTSATNEMNDSLTIDDISDWVTRAHTAFIAAFDECGYILLDFASDS